MFSDAISCCFSIFIFFFVSSYFRDCLKNPGDIWRRHQGFLRILESYLHGSFFRVAVSDVSLLNMFKLINTVPCAGVFRFF